ncbi:MAG: ankyrin repeat domain-containing protein [Planctomycetota bacterium]
MSEFEKHLKAANDTLNRLLATITDPDQGKLVAQMFNNITDAMCALRAERDAATRSPGAQKRADSGEKPVPNGRSTPLHAAVDAGDMEGVKRLLADGADMNARDENGCTPLSRAVLRGHMGVAEFLVSKGAGVNVQAKNGWTALDIAAHRRSSDLVTLLRSYGGKLGNELKARA